MSFQGLDHGALVVIREKQSCLSYLDLESLPSHWCRLTDSTSHSNTDGAAKRALGGEGSPWEGCAARARRWGGGCSPTAALEAVKQHAKRGSDPCTLKVAVCEGLCSARTHKLSLTFNPVSGLWRLKEVAGIQVGLCQEGHRGPRTGETVKQSSEGRKKE